LTGFLGRVAFYARYGYLWYAIRKIPEGKDLEAIDQKLRDTYGVTYQRMKRKTRKDKGLSNVMYVRWKQWFVLLGTPGRHETFTRIYRKHMGVESLFFGGYVVTGDGAVLVAPRRWKRIEGMASRIALHNERKVYHFFHVWLNQKIAPLPLPGITRQKWRLWKEVNERRRVAGLPLIPALPWQKSLLEG